MMFEEGKILHGLVQNLYIIERQTELTEIRQVPFAITRAVFLLQVVGKVGNQTFTILCTYISILLFFDNTATDIPICRKGDIPDGSIGLTTSLFYYRPDIIYKSLG